MIPLETLQEMVEAWLGGEELVFGLLTANTVDWDTERLPFVDDVAADRSTNHPEIEKAEPDFAVASDVANVRVEVDCIDLVWTALPLGDVGDGKIQAVYVARRVTNDADSPVIKVIDVTALPEVSRTPNGTDYTVRIPTEGLIHVIPGDAA